MIALIEFITTNSALPVKKEVFEKYSFTEYTKDSYKLGTEVGENEVQVFNSYHIYSKDLIKEVSESGNISYKTEEGKSFEKYYIIEAIPNEQDYIAIEKQQLVNLVNFVSSWQGVPFKIIKGVQEKALPELAASLQEILNTVEKKTEELKKLTEETLTEFSFNQKCNVHVGGGMIATFNDILLLEDSCSDVLQESLTKGWRIIAACVQPDQRRPDYVLGRYNPNLDVSISCNKSV